MPRNQESRSPTSLKQHNRKISNRRMICGSAMLSALVVAACTKVIGIDGEYTQQTPKGADAADALGDDAIATGDAGADQNDVDSDAQNDAFREAQNDSEREAQSDAPGDSRDEDVVDAPEDRIDAPSDVGCSPPNLVCGSDCVDPLTHGSHCGQCDHSCCGGACNAGVCEAFELVRGVDRPKGVTVDDTHVYWTDPGGSAKMVAKAPKGQHSEADAGIVVLATGLEGPEELVVHDGYVYWTNSTANNGGHVGEPSVMRVSVDGGTPETLSSVDTYANGIAVDPDYVFWTNRLGSGGTVNRKPLDGGPAEFIASGQQGPKRVQVLGDRVYWTNINGWQVMSAPIAGGDASVLADDAGSAHFLAVSSVGAFWTTDNSTVAFVGKVQLDGGSPHVFAPGQYKSGGIAIDEKDHTVYWATEIQTGGADGMIMKAPADESRPPLMLAKDNTGNGPFGLAIDDSCVYWTVWSRYVRVIAKKPDVTKPF
jgi:hypothetical protein